MMILKKYQKIINRENKKTVSNINKTVRKYEE